MAIAIFYKIVLKDDRKCGLRSILFIKNNVRVYKIIGKIKLTRLIKGFLCQHIFFYNSMRNEITGIQKKYVKKDNISLIGRLLNKDK
ncbi:hypothetical protein V1477_004516 [Vespula maculifrons]|uniref:Uncharacterized protein n=1 Tax=Vespula maculifrons TaxID=7453 RepID=A0ABD2CMB3_VESMC